MASEEQTMNEPNKLAQLASQIDAPPDDITDHAGNQHGVPENRRRRDLKLTARQQRECERRGSMRLIKELAAMVMAETLDQKTIRLCNMIAGHYERFVVGKEL